MESDINEQKQSFAAKQLKQTDGQKMAFRNQFFGPSLLYK